MEYKILDCGFRIPSLGFGTWLIGGRVEADTSRDKEGVAAIKSALDLGYDHIDTAEMYGGGHTEELVGESIKGRQRSDLFITSKVLNTHLEYQDVLKAADASLIRLGTDYFDLYLVHAPNPEVPISETMRAMDELVKRGKTRYVGVSNFTVEQLREAQAAAGNKIVANQIEYSLMTRNKGKYGTNHDMESRTLPYCQDNDIIVMAERPVERGLLLEPHPLMDELADKYSKTRAQIAINWLIGKKNVVTIPMSTDPGHQKENLGALGWNLDVEDRRRLDGIKFDLSAS